MMKITISVLLVGFILAHSAVIEREKRFVRQGQQGQTEKKEEEESFVLQKKPDDEDLNENKNKEKEENFVNEIAPGGGGNTNSGKSSNVRTFWHLSDMHLDFLYNWKSDNKSAVCPSSYGKPAINPGAYGDYRCDAPWKLLTSAVAAMEKFESSPDFIIWTGDDTLHTSDENQYLSEKLVLETIQNITNLIQDHFKNTVVYPALGNHDYHPKNHMPAGQSRILSEIADMWSTWLKQEAVVFKDGGYYTVISDKNPNLQIVVLNTNLWYTNNKEINGTVEYDPAGQFQFLTSVLERALADNMKVYIVGHIPPGYFELAEEVSWLYPQYNARYIELVKKYSKVILGQFFGHHHTDSFRIFKDDGGSASTAFIAPGVTPWMTTLPGVDDGANNPGIRLFEFDADSLELLDYRQYYLDLDKANHDSNDEWQLEYRAKDAFNIPDIGVTNMHNLYKTLRDADVNCDTDCEKNDVLQKFALYNSVSYNKNKCDRQCQKRHTCAIGDLEQISYIDCLNSAGHISLNKLWTVITTIAVLLTLNWNC